MNTVMVEKQKILIWDQGGTLGLKLGRRFGASRGDGDLQPVDPIARMENCAQVEQVESVSAAIERLKAFESEGTPVAVLLLSGMVAEEEQRLIIEQLEKYRSLEVIRFLDTDDLQSKATLEQAPSHYRFHHFLGQKLFDELAYLVSASLCNSKIRRGLTFARDSHGEKTIEKGPNRGAEKQNKEPCSPLSNNSPESLHSQKLEAVGQLAAGIAHEINTPIQFVSDSIHFLADCFEDLQTLLGHYQSVVKKAEGKSELEKLVVQVREYEEEVDLEYLMEAISPAITRTVDGVQRVAEIVRAMKEFARPDMREMASADLNRAIMSTLVVARAEYRYVAEVETDLQEIPQVTCHLGDVNQVFLNLIVNAAHAIADKNKASGDSSKLGKIVLRSRVDGERVIIEIEDTGAGIPDKIRTRIFDPFFTTKEVGRGTGQGLAIARTIIIEKHGGEIEVMSKVGEGTTFRIALPVHRDEAIQGSFDRRSQVA